MAINENVTVQKILTSATRDAAIYFNDWDRASDEGDERGKAKADGQIDAILRLVRRIDTETYDMLKADRAARTGTGSWTPDGISLDD
ncbi:hypothetical protein L612_009800000010 [Rhodococcus rhodochrous J38]|uniref:hypothetical protein n=1 Tax=Rhodococcus rhodochrous TaxID=1829 RepID=UPI0011A16A62|nr:hypothetical protein [Rhodococcus rhodochrous]TWH36252.1 hypothetical protein L612_009800000010 [Rhodococcus rhodochrous J38]